MKKQQKLERLKENLFTDLAAKQVRKASGRVAQDPDCGCLCIAFTGDQLDYCCDC